MNDTETEFVRLTGEPWHGDSANLIKLMTRVGCSISGPFIYEDRSSRERVMKRSEQIKTMNNFSRESCNALREDISYMTKAVDTLRRIPLETGTPSDTGGEFFANVTLAYRHLEDAYMRLGNAIQALDSGVSVYDK